MVFSSAIFLVYFLPLFIFIYYLSKDKYKNIIGFFASVFFYTWGGPKFIFLILISLILDYVLVNAYDKSKHRKLLLVFSLIINIGMLAYFKYANFFVDNLNFLLQTLGFSVVSWTKIVLPIGISFFTFQKMSYSIDVYQRKHQSLTSFFDYGFYILFFPQLIAGPIIRFGEIVNQLGDRSSEYTAENQIIGLFRFSVGLAKKVLIANVLGAEADRIFLLDSNELTFSLAWYGALAYTFQIYFDFSGYSDMAIGIGRILGFKIPENFNYPYISKSITEFWRRWHITLGKWMKDYLYIPLGGNKLGQNRMFLNLWLVFLFSGLWHGAGWTFILWGAYHGAFIVMDKVFLRKKMKLISPYIQVFINFVIVIFGWILFRAETISYTLSYWAAMLDFSSVEYIHINQSFFVIFIFAFIFSFIGLYVKWFDYWENILNNNRRIQFVLLSVFSVLFILVSSASIISSSFNPFIYFRF